MEDNKLQNNILKVIVSENNTHIDNSFRIIYKEDMEDLLNEYRHKYNSSIFSNFIINRRSITSMVYEWAAHNLLYQLGLFKSHTKDVDLDDEPLYRRICYYVLGWIWFKFNDKYDLSKKVYNVTDDVF